MTAATCSPSHSRIASGERSHDIPTALAALPRTTIPLLPFAPLGVDALARVFDEAAHAPDRARAAASALTGRHAAPRDARRRARRPRPRADHDDGQGRRRQDHDRRRDRRRARPPRSPRPPLDDRPRRARRPDDRRRARRTEVSRIDPAAETRGYTERGPRRRRRATSTPTPAPLLEEDLRSPCTEEIAIFRAFARTVADADDGIRGSRHRADRPHAAAARRRPGLPPRDRPHEPTSPSEIAELLPRLRDPEFARVLLVTLPEATPVHEAAQLADDLRRAEHRPLRLGDQPEPQPGAAPRPRARPARPRRAPLHRRGPGRSERTRAIVGWQPQPPVGKAQLGALLAAA